MDTLSESLIEVTSGQAKYEHQHRALVWRMPRLPKEGQGESPPAPRAPAPRPLPRARPLTARSAQARTRRTTWCAAWR